MSQINIHGKNLIPVLLIFVSVGTSLAQSVKYPFQRGDSDGVSEISWSPRNDLILTSSGDENGLRLWEVKSGKVRWKTDVGFLQDGLERYSIRHSAWTNDQKLIVTATDNGKLQLWDATNGKLIWNIKAHVEDVTAIAISPDSKMVVSSADLGDWKSGLKLWSLTDGRLIKDLSANQKDITAIRFIDENRFQTGNGFGQITTWSARNFSPITTKQLSPCGRPTRDRTYIAYSPDFSLLAAPCRAKLVVKQIKTNKTLTTIDREKSDGGVSFSPDNRVLLLAGSGIFHLPTTTRKEFRQFGDGVLNNDGSLVATFASYRADGVQIFDTQTGERRSWLMGHPGVIKSLAFSSDGRLFFSGSADRIVRVWDTQSRTLLFSLEGHTDDIESLVPGKDGRTLVSRSEKETIVWDVDRGVKLGETQEELRLEKHSGEGLSPSGKLALVEEYGKPFRLVDRLTNRTIREFVYIDQLDNLVFCPDEKHFLAKPWWNGWQLWSIDGSKPIREFDLGYSFHNQVAFHPNGKVFITGGEGQNILMFDLETGDKIWSLFEIDQEELASNKAGEARRIAYLDSKKERARLAGIQNQPYVNKVYIRFDHYGDMTPLGERRMAESDTPNKSKTRMSAADATAIWLRLHNDSPLPVSIPTQSIYLLNFKCFHEFPDGNKLQGLCDKREISVWLGLEDKNGESLPYGFDFGSSVILLPDTSVVFAVPRDALSDGRAITFSFTFQMSTVGKIEDYGNRHVLRFREEDLPKRPTLQQQDFH